jgi:hypothetical protein
MRAFIAICGFLVGAGPCLSQESCDVRSTVEAVGNTIVFRQLMFCGDGDPVTTLTCTPGKSAVRASLPIGDAAKGPGEIQIAVLEIGGKKMKKRLRITSETTSEAVLDVSDPLRKALLTPGLDIPVSTENFSTSIGILDDSAASLADWKAQCGFE